MGRRNPSASLQTLKGEGGQAAWAFYDLRPLRSKLGGWSKTNPGLEPILTGDHAMIVFDRVRAAQSAINRTFPIAT